MESHFTGPYEIVKELGKGVYRLKNLKTNKILAKTYSSIRFKLYHSADVSPNPPQKRKREESEGPPLEEPLYKGENWIVGMNLKTSDREAMETNCELNDRCMDAVSYLLRQQFPAMKGLQSTLIVDRKEHCEHIGRLSDSVQIIHQKCRNHWIASAVKDGEVYIYDSLQSPTPLPSQTKTVLQNLYGDMTEYITTDVTQQSGSVDCGVFAAAFVTAVCFGLEPEDYRFNQQQMRKHLLSCLEAGELTPFPATKKRQRKPLVQSKLE